MRSGRYPLLLVALASSANAGEPITPSAVIAADAHGPTPRSRATAAICVS